MLLKLNSVAFSSGFSYTYCVLSIFIVFYKVRGCVVNLVGHGSCIMGRGSVFVWVSGSWVTACDPLFTLPKQNDQKKIFSNDRKLSVIPTFVSAACYVE